jgi:trimethylamine:corrinoid methyltransferase-like protein
MGPVVSNLSIRGSSSTRQAKLFGGRRHIAVTKSRTNDVSYDGGPYARISPQQRETLHKASLEILARTGAGLRDQEAIDLLRKGSAFISEGNLVRVPAGLVDKILAEHRPEPLSRQVAREVHAVTERAEARFA